MLLAIGLSVMLASCANTATVDKDAQITQNWSVQRLYAEAHDELNGGNYTRAVKLYEILESRFPYGRYAEQAQLDTAYAYYRDREPEKSLVTLNNFIRMHPQHPNLDYALYLQALVLFNEEQTFLNKLASQDWADRDPKANREAYAKFAELLARYPNSKYAESATEYMQKLVDALGGNEMAIARYYMKRGAYLAAANRAAQIVAQYQNTRYVEESLAMMVTAYQKLDKKQLSDDARRVLAQNYPNSRFLSEEWESQSMPWWQYWK